MGNQLEKIMGFIRRTGDRVVVFDHQEPSQAYVVMSLDEYERKLLANSGVQGLTEEELLDKINRDIAVWKSQSLSFVSETVDDFVDLTGQESLEDDYDYRDNGSSDSFVATDSFRDGNGFNRGRFSKSSNWRIPRDRKAAAEKEG